MEMMHKKKLIYRYEADALPIASKFFDEMQTLAMANHQNDSYLAGELCSLIIMIFICNEKWIGTDVNFMQLVANIYKRLHPALSRLLEIKFGIKIFILIEKNWLQFYVRNPFEIESDQQKSLPKN